MSNDEADDEERKRKTVKGETRKIREHDVRQGLHVRLAAK
jgi:hypothetical protein